MSEGTYPLFDCHGCSSCDRLFTEEFGSVNVDTCGPDTGENFCHNCTSIDPWGQPTREPSELVPRIQVASYEDGASAVVILFGRLCVEVYPNWSGFVNGVLVERECNPLDHSEEVQLPPRLLSDRLRYLIESALYSVAVEAAAS